MNNMSSLQWTGFPSEIQREILNEVLVLEEVDKATQVRLPESGLPGPLSKYARVSRDWQEFFEEVNFHRILLSRPCDLAIFQWITERRLHRSQGEYCMPPIRHIWLHVDLLRYECQNCLAPENDREVEQNDIFFSDTIKQLFQTLSIIPEDQDGRGLELEFSAGSPSDSEHFFKPWHHVQKDYPHCGDLSRQKEYVAKHQLKVWDAADEQHGAGSKFGRQLWAKCVATAWSQNREAISRRLIRPLRLANMATKLPVAKIVTGLLIRRQFFRDISTSSLRHLLQSLPCLRTLRRENWRLPLLADRKPDDGLYSRTNGPWWGANCLLPALPEGLTTLQLFEDFEMQLHGRYDVERPRDSRIKLLSNLARSTPRLQELSVGFLTEAIDAFGLRNFYLNPKGIHNFPIYPFKHLENVILTSQEHLRPDQSRHKINCLLRAAAAVALKMPRLRVMELWNCADGHASVFRYDSRRVSKDRACTVTWRSNWDCYSDLVIEPDVMEAFARVARAHYPNACSPGSPIAPVRFVRHRLPDEECAGFVHGYLSYGAVLPYLELRHLVLHPISAMQACEEASPSDHKLLWYQHLKR
ncbi:hypothetical protein GE09DRAFT_60087 [Coniochaeta sp. 2T2.1]|nr:hypothetical protein GE09DRAFT_60087 [Coniochaeta sp. 2T2.1]